MAAGVEPLVLFLALVGLGFLAVAGWWLWQVMREEERRRGGSE